MVGFALAIAGGAMRGWGEGQMAAIKAQREEKLHMLDQQFMASQNELTRQVQREELASRERMGQAQITATSNLATEERKSREALTKLQLETQERISTAGNVSTESIAAANRAMNENLQKLQNAGAKQIAQMQIDAQKELNSTMVPMADGTWKLKVGGELRDLGNDPETGKPLMPLATDNDTPEMRNYKFLISIGTDPAKAMQATYGSKNSDEMSVRAGLYKVILEQKMGDFSSGSEEEDNAYAEKTTDQLMQSWKEQIGAPAGAPAAPQPPAVPQPPDTSATEPTLTPAQKQAHINAAREALRGGAARAAVEAQLKRVGLTLADTGM